MKHSLEEAASKRLTNLSDSEGPGGGFSKRNAKATTCANGFFY